MTVTAVLIGVGNPMRRDDGAGPVVADAVRARCPAGVVVHTCDGDPVRLLDWWAGAPLVVLVDAVGVGAVPVDGGVPVDGAGRCAPGQVIRTDVDGVARLPRSAGTHGLGVAEVIGLAGALGRLPGRLVVFGVRAGDTGPGEGLSPAVRAAVPGLVEAVLAELATAAGCRRARRPVGPYPVAVPTVGRT